MFENISTEVKEIIVVVLSILAMFGLTAIGLAVGYPGVMVTAICAVIFPLMAYGGLAQWYERRLAKKASNKPSTAVRVAASADSGKPLVIETTGSSQTGS